MHRGSLHTEYVWVCNNKKWKEICWWMNDHLPSHLWSQQWLCHRWAPWSQSQCTPLFHQGSRLASCLIGQQRGVYLVGGCKTAELTNIQKLNRNPRINNHTVKDITQISLGGTKHLDLFYCFIVSFYTPFSLKHLEWNNIELWDFRFTNQDGAIQQYKNNYFEWHDINYVFYAQFHDC